MLGVLGHRVYGRLFAAQVVALLGTGLATVALALMARDLAGPAAGQVLGTALALKMVAYVGLSPFAAALAERLPRRGFLVALDLFRVAVALALPFVTAVWQVYALVLLLQAASAAFTPAFQATIPDVLEDERAYTSALSLSRLAYDLEALASPVLAAVLLSVMSFHGLFAGTALGFALSAALVMSVVLPPRRAVAAGRFLARAGRGLRLYLALPPLRGVMALNLCVAAGGAMVLVNTVVLVAPLAPGAAAVGWALAAFGAGSMAAALALPRLLDRLADRTVMLAGGAVLTGAMVAGAGAAAAGGPGWTALLALWALAGAGYGAAQTPTGRLLRAASLGERPALFAAQFALSHAGWLVAYPLAGWTGAILGLPAAFAVMAVLGTASLVLSVRLWPAAAPPAHRHDDLPAGHPHLAAHARDGGGWHRHGWLADPPHG